MIYDLAVEPAGLTGGSSLELQSGMRTDLLCPASGCSLAQHRFSLVCNGTGVPGDLNQDTELYIFGLV